MLPEIQTVSDLLERISKRPADDSVVLAVTLLLLPRDGNLNQLLLQKLAQLTPKQKTPELKDRFLSLAVRSFLEPGRVGGAEIAQSVNVLVQSEVAVSGPYKSENGEVDLCTNLLIALFLQQQRAEAKGLQKYIIQSLESFTITNYDDRILLLLLCSLNFVNKVTLGKLLRSNKSSDAANIELVMRERKGIHLRTSSGSFEKNCEHAESGSRIEMIEAAAYLASQSSAAPKTLLISTANSDAVYAAAMHEIKNLSNPLRQNFIRCIQKIKDADTSCEISLFSQYLAHSFHGPVPGVSNQVTITLGVANIFCWVAYSIYDDYIDDAAVDPQMILVANTAMRRSIQLYNSAAKNSTGLPDQLFDLMDQANSWELSNTRFKVAGDKIIIQKIPDYGDGTILFHRAAGHIAGPLLIARLKLLNEQDAQKFQQALHHYIIAKQMNDDLHDWSEDLKRGHCSIVLAQLLKSRGIQPKTYSLSSLHHLLQNHFQQVGFLEITKAMKWHVKLANLHLSQIADLSMDSNFVNLVLNLGSSITKSVKVYKYQQDFLTHYKSDL